VHIDAHCTCGEKIEGVGNDESAVAEALWAVIREHKKGKNTKRTG